MPVIARRGVSLVALVASALIAAIAIKSFVLDLVAVKGGSMVPAMRTGTVAVVLRCAYGLADPIRGGYLTRWAEPKVGDIVVVDSPDGMPGLAVKRVFEVGPAFVEAQAGELHGSGGSVALEDRHIGRAAGSSFLPRDRVMVIGDAAVVSFDSRDYGSVPIEKIIGKVVLYPAGKPKPAASTEPSRNTAVDVDR